MSLIFGQMSIFSLASFQRLGTRRTTSRGFGHKRPVLEPAMELLNDRVVYLLRGRCLGWRTS